MTERQKQIKEYFLEPETRCGYFVSAAKKAVWKVQLDMLEHLLFVCRKYNLSISLAAGSLLGAIRHKGFIPWDDDFDVMLPRSDFNKLMEIGPKEFKSPYFFQSPRTDPGYVHAMAKLRNSKTTAVVPRYAQEGRMCNMGIFIDIYPIDPVPKSEAVIRRKIAIMRLFHKLRANAYSHCRRGCAIRRRFLHICALIMHTVVGSEHMFELQQKIFLAGLSKLETRGVCMSPAVMKFEDILRFTYPERILKEGYVYVPFEYMEVPVFAAYEQMLTRTYGEWRNFVIGASGHQELVLDALKPYTAILRDEYGYTEREINKLILRG